jgi:purine nucleosidase
VPAIHLDSDLGSDTDDLCALAMLLGWPDVEVVGVTTVSDPGGMRAAMVEYTLDLCGRNDVPVVAGAEGSLGGYADPYRLPDYWPEPIDPRPARPGEALDLLAASVERGAGIVAIGPYTNLALLEAARPGVLRSVPVTVMGGSVHSPGPGLPPWGWDQDYNVQQDHLAAKVVFERCDPLIVQLAVTLEVWLTEGELPALRSGGPLARLIADQGERHGRDHGMAELGRSHEGLPDDLLNFHYDPLACAVACGWDGVEIEEVPLRTEVVAGRLRLHVDPAGKPSRVVREVDSVRFSKDWLDAVLRAARDGSG